MLTGLLKQIKKVISSVNPLEQCDCCGGNIWSFGIVRDQIINRRTGGHVCHSCYEQSLSISVTERLAEHVERNN